MTITYRNKAGKPLNNKNPRRTMLRLLLEAYEPRQDALRKQVKKAEDALMTAITALDRTKRILRRARSNHMLGAEKHYIKLLKMQVKAVNAHQQAVDEARQNEVDHAISAHDLYEDLVVLEKEFGEVTYDFHSKEISVTTDSIRLEDEDGNWMDFGHFDLIISLTAIPGAYDPVLICSPVDNGNPSGDYYHPHINNEILCMGDAKMPFKNAIAQGRILDAFELASTTIHSYNGESVYRSIADWIDGENSEDDETDYALCHECGDEILIGGENDQNCDYCGHTICQDCSRYCNFCEGGRCANCISDQCACEIDTCRRCRRRCPQCRLWVSPGCLEDNNDVCCKCAEGALCAVCGDCTPLSSRMVCGSCSVKNFQTDMGRITTAPVLEPLPT